MEGFNDAWNKLIAKLDGWFDGLIVNLPNILIATAVLTFTIYLSQYLKKYVRKLLIKTTSNTTLSGLGSNVIVAAFVIVMLVVILSILNLDTAVTSLLGTAGVMGLAVGLALQDPMINLFSGVLMSVRTYYSIGDLVKTNDHFGTILKINLRSTIIMTPDGQEVIIPNKEVLQTPLTNYSHNYKRRIDLSCGIGYGDDLEKVKSIAEKAIKDNVKTIPEKEIEFFYTEFGDSSINFVVRYWKDKTSQSEYLRAKSEGIMALKKAFDQANITIPFPIRTLDFGVSGGLQLNKIYDPELFTPNDA